MWKFGVVAVLAAGGATAQVVNLEAEGNLAATYEVGCLAVRDVRGVYSPADLAGGVLACFAAGEDDLAVEMLMVMQLRGVFDSLRVADKSAHQAGQVLKLEMAQQAGPEWAERMTAGFERFGAIGAPRHMALCKQMEADGPPTHAPGYMVQHGMQAFTGLEGDGLVAGFEAEVAWERVLDEFLDCWG